MATLTLSIRGIERILQRLTPELYQPAVQELLRSAALLAEREARSEAPRDTSALARSITSEVQPLRARVFSTLAYAVPVEAGRRPGAKMPPPQALEGWMRRHGLDGVSPFVLARAIARRGIRGRFFMRKARDRVQRALPSLALDAARLVERRWGAK